MKLTEKVAYIKGLMDGLNPEDSETKKVLEAVIDVLEDMAEAIREIDDTVNDLDEYVGELDEDLQEVEDLLIEDDACACDCCDCEDDFYTVICPKCGEEFCVDEEIIEDGKVNCPSCNEQLEFDLSDDEQVPEEE